MYRCPATLKASNFEDSKKKQKTIHDSVEELNKFILILEWSAESYEIEECVI
jgi:hypothetical protein